MKYDCSLVVGMLLTSISVSADRIEVSQLDEGNSYPYYYDINASTESETLVVSLSDNAFSNHDVKVSVISDGTYLSFDMPENQRSSSIEYALIPLTSIGSDLKLQGVVPADNPKIDISNLPKGYYGISYVCHGKRFTSKFAKL